MPYSKRIIELGAAGAGSIFTPTGRLAGLKAQGGTVTMHNRGNVFAAGDRLLGAEELIEGNLVFLGSPNAKALAYFHF